MSQSRINTGGPAFPIECNIVHGIRQDEGISTRDYFAAKALQAYMAWSLDQMRDEFDTKEKAAARYAKAAYCIADAMISEREKAESINAEIDKKTRDEDRLF